MCNLIIFQINIVHSKEKARALFCEPSVSLECPTDIWGGGEQADTSPGSGMLHRPCPSS
jgi:hypothetical protein